MAKYLVQVHYTTEGLKGLIGDSASGRRADVHAAVKALGGKLESFYYCFSDYDAVAILDLPSDVTAAAFSLAVRAPGTVQIRTTPLLTVEEVDQALEIHPKYRAPGE